MKNERERLRKESAQFLNTKEWDHFISFHYKEPNRYYGCKDYRSNPELCIKRNTKILDYILSYLNPNRTKIKAFPIAFVLEKGTNAGKGYIGHYHCHLLIGKIPKEQYFSSKNGRQYLAKRGFEKLENMEDFTRTEQEYFLQHILKSVVLDKSKVVGSFESALDIRPVWDSQGIVEYVTKKGIDSLTDIFNLVLRPEDLPKKEPMVKWKVKKDQQSSVKDRFKRTIPSYC
ncbi:hypothetical protein VZG47_00235 (plasmid) [Synechococcus elongatus IITB5]